MKNKIFGFMCLIALLAMSTFFAVAEGGQGGGNSPLTLESVTPADGSTGVTIDTSIELIFSNNVINEKVKEGNLSCFTLKDKTGQAIAIEVIMADDMLQPEMKNTIVIKPELPLEERNTYTLTIDKNLQSKNGSKLGENMDLEFNTISPRMIPYNLILVVAILAAGVYVFIFKKDGK